MGNNMETVVESEYQDIYRVTDGVLLIVNKFRRIDYSSQIERCVILYEGKYKSYNKNCQKQLKMLKEDCNMYGITIPKGTVTYDLFPVEIVSDKADYKYEIKTTGNMFSGNNKSMLKMINEIISKIK